MDEKKQLMDPDILKISFYNFYINKEDDSIYVFNTATGAILHIFEAEYIQRLTEIRTVAEIPYDPNDGFIYKLYNIGILVPSDRDEYEYVRYRYERDVIRDGTLSLMLITTRQCNLRCVYCYEKHENKPMKVETYANILSYIENVLKNRYFSSVSIGLFGGEPFVEYDNVIDFLESAKKLCESYDVPFNASATTNGALIYPERFERLILAGCSYYQITIDGFEETHDKYRINANGKGSWHQIIDNLKYMTSTSYEFKVTIRSNFNEEVFSRVKEWYEFIRDNFDNKRFSVYYEGIKKLGGSNDTLLDVLNQEQVSKSSFDVAQFINKLDIQNDVVDFMTRPYSQVCYASKHNNYLIDYDGTILKCTLALDDDLNRIGYIDDEGIMHINENKHSKWIGHKIELPNICNNCRVLPICFGGRCINGRLHGDSFSCNMANEEQSLANLVSTYH